MKPVHYILLFAITSFGVLISYCKNGDKPTEIDVPKMDDPTLLNYSIITAYAHDTSSYTQGLVVYNGQMYEGTGNEGKSKLMQVDLKTGKIVRSISLDDQYFGEGITILNDTVYQLTWKNKTVFA